jgi:tetratricopeptide (TPR) repeat protein
MKKINFLRIIGLLQPLLYYGALLVIPLSVAFLFPLFSPFTLIKSTWFYIMGSLLLLITLFSFRLDKERLAVVLKTNFWKNIGPLFLVLIAFFVLSLFSVNFQQSFFGSYERQMGIMFYFWIFIWLALIVYYFHSYLFNNQGPEESWLRGVRNSAIFIMISSSLVSVYAFLQFVGYDFILWQEPQLLNRSISSLGQPNFLGSFLLFGLAMSAYLFYLYKSFRQRSFLFILILIQIVALILSGSRSAWLALIAVLFLLGILFFWKRFRYKVILMSVLFIVLSLGLFYLLLPTRSSAFLNWREGSVSLRAYFYKAAPQMISQNPLLGVGLENGGEVIVGHYQPEWGLFMKINGYSDKVHNSFLDITIQTGFLGLIFYILLHLFLMNQWLLLWRKKVARPFALAVGAALLAYGITLLFGLADLTNVFYFWILVSLIIAGNTILNNNESSQGLFFNNLKRIFSFNNSKSERLTILASFLSGLLAVIALIQIYFSFSALKADHYFLNFYKQSLNKEYFAADLLYSYVLEDAINPVNLANYQRVYASFIVGNFDEGFGLLHLRLFRDRAKDLSLVLTAQNYETLYSQARLKCFLQGASAAQTEFDDLKSLSSQRPSLYLDQGDCELSDSNKAIDLYSKALEKLPSLEDERLKGEHLDYLKFYKSLISLKLANVYYEEKEYVEASSFYKRAYLLNPQDIGLLKNIANTYFYLGDYDKAYFNLEHAYRRQPHHYWLIQLAALSVVLDNTELANEYWQKATDLANEEELGNLDNLIFP